MPSRRIVVNGVTGSGKTTLAARLARELDLTHIELDSLFHGPNWTPTPPDEFVAKVMRALEAAPEGWVVDGGYSRVRPLLLQQADTAIWIDLPWITSYSRMVRRTFTRMFRGEELWNGNKETPRLLLMSRDSLLLWGIHRHRHTRERIRGQLVEAGNAGDHSAAVHVVRSPREVEALVERLVADTVGRNGSGPLTSEHEGALRG